MTHRGQNSHVTIFTGHEDPEKSESSIDFAALAKLGGTQVMLMGVERIDAITPGNDGERSSSRFAGRADSLGDNGPPGNARRDTLEHRAARYRSEVRGAGGGGFWRVVSLREESELVRKATAVRKTDRRDPDAEAGGRVERTIARAGR